MAIPTTRTHEPGNISIDEGLCEGCGLCVEVCKDFSLEMKDGKVAKSAQPLFGCTGCGHCMAICPTGAIHVSGRTLSPDDLFELPPRDTIAGYAPLLNLLKRRRSIREYSTRPVEQEKIRMILDAAVTAPMGLPPSDVHVRVFDADALRQFSQDYCTHLEGMKWFVSSWFLTLMRPFWGKANDTMFRSFVRPLFEVYINSMKKGHNVVTYDAPLGMYFYGSPYSDPADPLIAATYAMLAGETLGLGTCMLGGIHPLIQNGRSAARLREKHKIRYKSREGLFVIFGYPAVHYDKGLSRSFAAVDF